MLKNIVKHPDINLVSVKNDEQLLASIKGPAIVYVDNNITDGYTHAPHFMMVLSSTHKFYMVFDPWVGRVSKISKDKLISGIDLLRSHIKFCPFIIAAS